MSQVASIKNFKYLVVNIKDTSSLFTKIEQVENEIANKTMDECKYSEKCHHCKKKFIYINDGSLIILGKRDDALYVHKSLGNQMKDIVALECNNLNHALIIAKILRKTTHSEFNIDSMRLINNILIIWCNDK